MRRLQYKHFIIVSAQNIGSDSIWALSSSAVSSFLLANFLGFSSSVHANSCSHTCWKPITSSMLQCLRVTSDRRILSIAAYDTTRWLRDLCHEILIHRSVILVWPATLKDLEKYEDSFHECGRLTNIKHNLLRHCKYKTDCVLWGSCILVLQSTDSGFWKIHMKGKEDYQSYLEKRWPLMVPY